jgi:hypothetical protein
MSTLNRILDVNTISTNLTAGNISLNSILKLVRFSKVTYQRDRVYGILALLPISMREQIRPSYNPECSNVDAYPMLSKAYLSNPQYLATVANNNLITNWRADIPSWALDLSMYPSNDAWSIRHAW